MTTKLKLTFPAQTATKPLSYHLVKDYDLTFNIFQARISPGLAGELAIEVTGSESNIKSGIEFLRSEGINVQHLSGSINHDSQSCVHCGACTAVCPSEALYMDENGRLAFDNELCVLCEYCIKTCPLSVLAIKYTE